MTFDRTVIYRPSRSVGLGHAIYCMAIYAGMARQLQARFVTTFTRSFGSLYGGEVAFLDDFFVIEEGADPPVDVSRPTLRKMVRRTRQIGGRVLQLDRADFPDRAQKEFPSLASARRLDIHMDQAQVTPEFLQGFDLIYADSILPPPEVIRRFAPLRPFIRLQPEYLERVKAEIGHETYIGLHARHGNGEHLHGRLEGGMEAYQTFLQNLATRALERKRSLGASTVLCLSDNAETAAELAQMTGGMIAGAAHLPDRKHQRFFREERETAPIKVKKLMFDFAALSGACHIVAAPSLFPRAADIVGGPPRLSVVPPDAAPHRDEAAR